MNYNRFKRIIRESINSVLLTESLSETDIVNYIKSFCNGKGRLQSSEESLKKYYKPLMKDAYEKMCDYSEHFCGDYVFPFYRSNGLAHFEWVFNTFVNGSFKLNKRGLIYVEREIELDKEKGTNELNYSSIGECWTYKPNLSRSYCSSFDLDSRTTKVTICGYVHPSSIDWMSTICLSFWENSHEKEIRMNNNAQVEITYIKINGQKYNLGGHYLINASANNWKDKW